MKNNDLKDYVVEFKITKKGAGNKSDSAVSDVVIDDLIVPINTWVTEEYDCCDCGANAHSFKRHWAEVRDENGGSLVRMYSDVNRMSAILKVSEHFVYTSRLSDE